MSDIHLVKQHGAGSLIEAKELVQNALNDMKTQLSNYISEIRWNDDNSVAELKGQQVSGTFTIDEKAVTVKLTLGWMAKIFKGPIENKIEAHLQREIVDKADSTASQ